MCKILKTSALIVLLTSATGCALGSGIHQKTCTSDWYSKVEKQVATGDDSGHGPDLGSGEWRSVVEFKLGIRGKPEVPSKNTDQWCDYINRHYIK